jgi:hypothetical protein
MTKADLVEIIGETNKLLVTDLQHILLNDKDKTPLASLSAATANLLVDTYKVRAREPVLAAMLGLAEQPAADHPAFAKLSAAARTAVEDVQKWKGLILQTRVTDCLDTCQLGPELANISGAGCVAILGWLVVMAAKLTGKKPAGMKSAPM